METITFSLPWEAFLFCIEKNSIEISLECAALRVSTRGFAFLFFREQQGSYNFWFFTEGPISEVLKYE